MTKATKFNLCPGVLFIAALLVAGCGTTQTAQFYTLSALDSQNTSPDLAVGENVAVGIGPVEFSKALRKPQIVTRTSPHRLNVDEFHRWGSPLDEDFTRVLAENMSTLLGTDRVAVFPWGEYFHPTYRIVMHVQRLEGQPGGPVVLDARWTLLGEDGKELTMTRSLIEEPPAGGGYEGLVAAKSRAVAILSREIAQEIHGLESEGKS